MIKQEMDLSLLEAGSSRLRSMNTQKQEVQKFTEITGYGATSDGFITVAPSEKEQLDVCK